MTKFKTFEAQPRDFFRSTDPNTIVPLIPFILGKTFAEPCAGALDLVKLLEPYATCNWASDIEPQVEGVHKKNALDLTEKDLEHCDVLCSNPPFSFSMLQPLLDHLPTLRPTWMLLPSDFMHNRQSRPYMDRCSDVVSVGRLFFHKAGENPMEVKYSRGTANNCWYLFHETEQITRFHGWVAK